MMLLKMIVVVVGTAAASRRQGPTISAKCEEEFMKASPETEEEFLAIQECEQKNGYDIKVIAHLQDGDKKAAISAMEQSFQKCAKISEECSKEIAPMIITDLQMSGEAVSEECNQAMAEVQSDKEKMKEVEACEKKGEYLKKVQAALEKDDLDSAMDTAENSLEKCWGLSEKCAAQIAPVAVGQAPPPAEQKEVNGRPRNIQPGGRPIVTDQDRRVDYPLLLAKTFEKLSLIRFSKKFSLIDAALDRRKSLPTSNRTSFLQKFVKMVHLDSSLI